MRSTTDISCVRSLGPQRPSGARRSAGMGKRAAATLGVLLDLPVLVAGIVALIVLAAFASVAVLAVALAMAPVYLAGRWALRLRGRRPRAFVQGRPGSAREAALLRQLHEIRALPELPAGAPRRRSAHKPDDHGGTDDRP
jgi:hypothetical protein